MELPKKEEQPSGSPPPASPPSTQGTNSGTQAPPTNPPASPFAHMSAEEKDRLLSVYGRTIQAQRDELANTNKKVQDLDERITAATPPAPTDVSRAKSYFDDPVGNTRQLIREEINAAIAPLKEFVQSVAPQTEYDRLKAEVKNDPIFTKIFAAAEGHIDNQVRGALRNQAPGSKPTLDLVKAAALAVAGAASMGMLPDVNMGGNGGGNGNPPPTPTNTQPEGQRPVYSPPHLRPSAPPAPAGRNDEGPKYEFSELERRIMREDGLTEEQFLAGMNMNARDVVKKDSWPAERK